MCSKMTKLDYKKVFCINHNSKYLIHYCVEMNGKKVIHVYVEEIYIFLNLFVYAPMNLKDI